MQITKKIFRISFIFPCLLCMAISFAQEIFKFSCNFEDSNTCQWTQDKSDDFNWIRNQAFTPSESTGPHTDHTKGLVSLTNKRKGPASMQHSGGKCIHVLSGAFTKPKEGQFLVTHDGCVEDRLEFQLWPSGILMLTRYGMCVKPTGPVTDGVRVGIFSSCDATDTWSWTARGSLQYKKKMCLKPETGGRNPKNNAELVLDSVCDERENLFEFMLVNSAFGWYLYIGPRQPNNKARLISPSTTKAKSCLLFFYYMYGYYVNELRVYVKSGGNMYPVWSLSGEQGDKWYQAQVGVNNQTASYQFVIEGVRGKNAFGDIAIDDISLMDSCPPRENPTSVSTTPTISPSQTICGSEDKGTMNDSGRIIIIVITLGVGVLLSIALSIVFLIKYKRLKRALNLSSPVNIPLETNEISPEAFPVDEEAVYETVANVDRKFYEDVATNANESEDISTEGRTLDYVIPAHERREMNEDIKMRRNLPDYERLDPSKREAHHYQKLVKT